MTKAQDWLQQAEKDLVHAEKSKEISHFEWAVLAAHQSAEKAIKALFYQLGADAWGHALYKLLKNLPSSISDVDALFDSAKYLDKHYITSRYPNGFAEGAPEEYYTEKDAQEAIDHARKIVEFCESKISSLSKEENEDNE